MRVTIRSLAAVLLAGVALAAGSRVSAQQQDLSGTWELTIDGRRVPAASLAAGMTAATMADIAAKDARSVRWCLPLGMPFTMGGSGRPIEIRQGSRHMTIVAESTLAPVRYVYLDRASHVPTEEFEPTTSGDSIGRWEGDTLVVETIGFSDVKGMLAIPGGGFRTAATRLTERYRLLKDGSLLSVTFTWDDPKVFRAPHTYEFRYQRLPPSYEPRPPQACDAFDEERAAFLEKP